MGKHSGGRDAVQPVEVGLAAWAKEGAGIPG